MFALAALYCDGIDVRSTCFIERPHALSEVSPYDQSLDRTSRDRISCIRTLCIRNWAMFDKTQADARIASSEPTDLFSSYLDVL